eukprot:5327726-Pyramimonas_sp.AAC.1
MYPAKQRGGWVVRGFHPSLTARALGPAAKGCAKRRAYAPRVAHVRSRRCGRLHEREEGLFYIAIRPHRVRKECSAARVYTIFRALGLRHMCVVDADHCPIGMITRQNLMHAIADDDE